MKSTHNNMEAKSKLTCLNVVIVASDAVIGAFFLWFVLVMLRVLLLCVALCDLLVIMCVLLFCIALSVNLLVILCVNYLCLLSLSIMAWLRIGSWECMLSLQRLPEKSAVTGMVGEWGGEFCFSFLCFALQE